MNKIVIDKDLRTRLDNLDTELELCDESGHTLGYFVPTSETNPSLYESARCEFTEEEIESARKESGGLTISEVLEGFNEE